MGAVALAVIWLGYATGMWGYCLVRGYCVTPMNIISPSFPATMAKAGSGTSGSGKATTPTPPIPNTAPSPLGPGVIIPVIPNPADPLNPSNPNGLGGSNPIVNA